MRAGGKRAGSRIPTSAPAWQHNIILAQSSYSLASLRRVPLIRMSCNHTSSSNSSTSQSLQWAYIWCVGLAGRAVPPPDGREHILLAAQLGAVTAVFRLSICQL